MILYMKGKTIINRKIIEIIVIDDKITYYYFDCLKWKEDINVEYRIVKGIRNIGIISEFRSLKKSIMSWYMILMGETYELLYNTGKLFIIYHDSFKSCDTRICPMVKGKWME